MYWLLGSTVGMVAMASQMGQSLMEPATLVPIAINCPPSQNIEVGKNCESRMPDFRAAATLTDNCNPALISITQTPLSGSLITGAGTIETVTLTADDGQGNVMQCSFEISTVDVRAPSLECPNFSTLTLDANCEASLEDYKNLATVSDNCTPLANISVTQIPENGTVITGDDENPEVILTATDDSGNASTCSFTILLKDETVPTITCPENQTAVIGTQCQLPLPDLRDLATASDNCSDPVTVIQSPASGRLYSGAGTEISITLTAIDAAGHTADCDFTLTLEDEAAPMLSCPDNQVLAVDTDCAVAIPDLTGAIALSDNCSGNANIAIVQSPEAGTFVGGPGLVTPITITVTDEAGNNTDCSFDLTLVEQTTPTITCPGDQELELNTACEAELPDYTLLAQAHNQCMNADNLTLSQSPEAGTPVIDVTTVTITARDDNTNEVSCIFEVTPVDRIAPALECPENAIVALNGNCEYVLPSYLNEIILTDNCSTNAAITSVQIPAENAILSGVSNTETIAIVATDEAGNSVECTFEITLEDQSLPEINCPASQTVDLNANCQFVVPDYETSLLFSDQCNALDQLTFSQNIAPGSLLSGDNTMHVIELTVTDESNNEATCNFTLTLNDHTAPQIICPGDQTVSLNENCQAVIPDFTIDAVVSDHCVSNGNLTINQSLVPGSIISGVDVSQSITLTVNDGHGNSNNCSFMLTTVDCMAPTIICPANQIIAVDVNCEASLPDYTLQAIVDDQCTLAGNIIVSQDVPQGMTLSGPVPTIITLSADDGQGNISSCSFQVSLENNAEPEITCPDNQIIVADANCEASIPDYRDLATATDPCANTDALTLSQIPAIGTLISGVGTTSTVKIKVIDEQGNTTDCTFQVIVDDETVPDIACPGNQTIQLSGACEITLPDYRDEVVVADNCATVISLSQFPTAGTLISSPGTTQVVSITAGDGNGNLVNCSFSVTLADQTPPSITCPISQNVAADLNCSYIMPDYAAFVAATDDCTAFAEITITQSPEAGTSITANQEVIISAVDAQNNTAQCSFRLTLTDEMPPVMTCPANQEVALSENCELLLPNFIDAASITDHCTDLENLLITQDPPAGTLLTDSGAVETITINATDEAGNQAACSFNLIVNDQSLPTLICPGDQELNVTGDCQVSLPDYRLAAEIVDNCAFGNALTLTQTPAPGTLVGGADSSIEITLTADDGNGNQQSCTFNLTLTDAIFPSLTCPGDRIVEVNNNCNFGIPDYTDDAIVSQDCVIGSPQVSQSPPAGTIMSGHNVFQVITLTAGNSNCTFQITLKDLQAPSLSCPDNQSVEVDENCGFLVPDYTLLAVTSDNCTADNAITLTQNIASGTTLSGNMASVQMLITADDNNGNQAQCSFTLLLNDATQPSITCPGDQTVELDAQCAAVVPDLTHLATANDNCPTGLTITQDVAVGTILTGHNTTQLITLTAEDAHGNQNQCNFTLIATDEATPSIECPTTQVLALNANCEGELPDYRNLATATDDCSETLMFTQSPGPGALITGTNQNITLTANDGNGNSAFCVFSVTLQDNTDPSITCPADQEIDLGVNCEVALPDFTSQALVEDNCSASGEIAIFQALTPGTILSGSSGDQTIILTASDASGNTAQCAFILRVRDNEAPVIGCPMDHLLSLNDQCEIALPDYTQSAPITDNCSPLGVISTSQSPVAGSLLSGDGSSETITLSAVDAQGNTGTCSFVVNLEDNTAPTLICPNDQIIDVLGDCPVALPNYGSVATLSDNCTSNEALQASLTQNPPIGTTISGVGTTAIITLMVDDGNGNSQSCSFTVRLEESVSPSLSCPGDQLEALNDNCRFVIPDYTEDAIVFSDCSSDQITVTQSPPANTEISGHQTAQIITLTASDQNGGMETCSFVLTLEDDTPPTIICPPDPEVMLDDQCEYLVPDYTSQAIVTDNCRATNQITINQNVPVFTVLSGDATQEVTLTADDGNGNSNQCTFTILLLDMDDPTISCPENQNLTLDANCNATLPDYRNLANLEDNCAPLSELTLAQMPAAGTILTGHNTVTTVTLTVTDGNENTANCIFGVQLDDPVAPTISCPADQVLNVDEGCEVLLPDLTTNALASDNCTAAGDLQITQFPEIGEVLSGHNTSLQVTLTATDEAGNASNCILILTLKDNIPPSITCPENEVLSLDENCEVLLPSFMNAVTISDNCTTGQNLSISQVPAAGTILSGHGTSQLVTLIIADGNGQFSNCTLTVNLVDETDPMIECPMDQVLVVDENCEALLPDYTEEASFSDNCSSALQINVEQDVAAGTILGGHNTTTAITLTAEDGHGNSTFCTFNVTLEDQDDPTIVCPEVQDLNLSNFCQVELPDFTNLAIASDDCSTDLFFTQTPAGGNVVTTDTTITITVDDGNGNTAQCSFAVQLHDVTPPSIMGCFANLAVSNVPGMCHALVPDLTAFIQANDNCGIASVVQDSLPGTIFGEQDGDTQQIRITVTDVNGNTRVCNTLLILEDNEAPQAVCNDFSVTLNANGQADIVTANVNGGSIDNCGIASMTISEETYGCEDIGPNLVTLQVTDVNGNMSSCVSTVTVVDNTPPQAHCQNLTVTLLPPQAQVAINGTDMNDGSTDLCGIQSYSLSQDFFDCSDVGNTVVTMTVTDNNGNTANCQAIVSVNGDEVLPEAYAGEDVTICASEEAFVFVDQDFSPIISRGTGIWSTSGTGTFSNIDAFQPVYFPSQADIDNGQVTLTLTVTSNIGTCSGIQVQDELILILDSSDTDGDGICDSEDPCPDCLSTIYLGDDPNITDPCTCLNNATNVFDGQFSEVITVAGPEGLTWTILLADGLFEINSPQPPVLPTPIMPGTVLEETSPGIYQLFARHIDEIGFSFAVENEFGDLLTISSTCYYPNPSIVGLNDVYCVYSGPVDLVGDAEGVDGTGSFTIDGQPATVFDPNLLGPGSYEVEYTFDAGEAIMDDPDDPGCMLTISQTVVVEDLPTLATNNNVLVTLDQNCEAVILPEMIVEGTYTCLDDFIINVYAPDGTNLGDTVPADYSGQTLNVVVTTVAGPYVGFSTITLFDYSAPMIDCPDDTDRIPVSEQVQLLNGALGGSDLGLNLNNYSCYQNLINPVAGNHYYDVFSFTVSEADVYYFELNASFGNGIATLYQDSFEPANGICTNMIIQSNDNTTGIGYFNAANPISRIVLQLVPGETYFLFTSSVDPNITGAYQWAMYSEGTGLINELPAQDASVVRKLYCADLNEILDNPASLAFTGEPFASDNCSTVDYTFDDVVSQNGQCGDYVITRTFTATDGAGLQKTCSQTITLHQPTLDDLILPPLIYIAECDDTFPITEDGYPHPSVSGYPFIQSGFGIFNLDPLFCGLASSFNDQPAIETCESGYKLVRNWTLLNGCDPSSFFYYNQIINVDDFTGPAITCPTTTDPEGIIYSTGPFDCTASFEVPLPEVTDNCSTWEVSIQIVTDVEVPVLDQWGQVIGTTTETVVLANIPAGASRYITGIPTGCHRFKYTVTDACDNTNVLECDFCVEDRVEPTAVCDDDLTVTLGGVGYARLYAIDVDEGSSDNCELDRVEVRRLVTQNPNSCEPVAEYYTVWSEFVELYCCDVNQVIMVELRAVDTVGNENICTMEVLVEDKIRPFCTAPPNKDVACNTLPYNFEATDTIQLQQLFGNATVEDNCPTAIGQEMEPIVNLDDCGFGNIIRRFRAIDLAGNISGNTCQQVVNILPVHNYEIRFPKDLQASCGNIPNDSLEINGLACDHFAIGMDEETFTTSEDGCYKIFRNYRVVNWCEYDGISPARTISRDEDCDGNPGDEDVWVLVRPGGVVYIDRDINEFNNAPVAFAKGTSCDGLSNPSGHWINSNISGTATPPRELTSVGFWQYQQHISVIDNTDPIISVASPDPFCSENGNTCMGTATINFTVDENCTPDDLTINLFDEANPTVNIAGEVLSGNYPTYQITGDFAIGNHILNLVVADGCGNAAAKSIAFQIVDCLAPTPVCIDGLSVELSALPPNTDADGDGDEDRGAASISASAFVASPINDCTEPVRYSIHRADSVAVGAEIPSINQDSLVVTCDEIGNVLIRIYAWDSANNPYALQPDGSLGGPNYDFCETTLLVQDNMGVCIDLATISGRIATEEDEGVEGVEVTLSGQLNMTMYTPAPGYYTFEEVPYGYDYTVTPHLDTLASNGVSTFDMIIIKQHILGTSILDSPYKIIAADVTDNGTISTADLIQIKQVVLGVIPGFPNNTSWRFVPVAYEFINPLNPLAEEFPEVISFNNLSGDDFAADFVAIKIGDVNLNANTSYLLNPDYRTEGRPLRFELEDQELRKGESYAIPVRAPQLQQVLGYQFTLGWNPDELTITEVIPGIARKNDFAMDFLESGLLTTSWYPEAGMTVDESPVFTLVVRAKRSGKLSDILNINSQITHSEGYHKNGQWLKPELFYTNHPEAFALFQNQPNPFSHSTAIGFTLPEASEVHLSIHTVTGQLLREWKGLYDAGTHFVEVAGKDLPEGVVLYYTLEAGAYKASQKMVKVK